MLRNKGKFKIKRESIDNYPDLVREVLSRFIVVRAEFMWESMSIEYNVISDYLPESSPECYPPEYLWKVSSGNLLLIGKDNGAVHGSWTLPPLIAEPFDNWKECHL